MKDDDITAASHSQLFGPNIGDMGESVGFGLNHKALRSFEFTSTEARFSLVT